MVVKLHFSKKSFACTRIRTHKLVTCVFLPGLSFITGICIPSFDPFAPFGDPYFRWLGAVTKTTTTATSCIT